MMGVFILAKANDEKSIVGLLYDDATLAISGIVHRGTDVRHLNVSIGRTVQGIQVLSRQASRIALDSNKNLIDLSSSQLVLTHEIDPDTGDEFLALPPDFHWRVEWQ